MRPAPVIRARDLSRSFGAFQAVKGVTFNVAPGEIFGYLGANGAGKSTTIRMLCGLLRPSSGQAEVAGRDVATDPEGVKRALGYMSQRFSLYLDLTVEENLEFFGGAYGLGGATLARRIDEALERVSLTDRRTARTGELPGGVRQQLALASALLHRPGILFLDEPTAGVDPANRRQLWRLIRTLAADRTTVFVTTHYMDEAEYCHRIGLMVAGELVALGTPAELKARHVQGRLYRLEGAALDQALPAIRGIAGVLDVQPFGAAAHLQVDPDALSQRALTEALARTGLVAASVEPVQPSLEDVFLSVVEGRG